MRILILTNYFTPDFSAGSFRMQAFVDAISRNKPDNLKVDLFTTYPNRYGKSNKKISALEDYGWLKIHRVKIPAHNGKMISQSFSYSVFFCKTLFFTRRQRYDLVFSTSSRLFTAFLGSIIASRYRSRLYLDIRDLFTDTFADLFEGSKFRYLLPVFNYLERKTIGSATAINVVSPGFVDHIKAQTELKEINVITNGIDPEFIVKKQPNSETKNKELKILYAGNIGDGQGLENIIPEAAKQLKGKARFKIIGAGGKRDALQYAVKLHECSNVEIKEPIARENLIQEYQKSDALFLHLNDFEAFKKVLPSKIFEYAASGKPIIAGVSGCAKDLLTNEISGSFVFPPNEITGLLKIVDRLQSEPRQFNRKEFTKKYGRELLMEKLFASVLAEI